MTDWLAAVGNCSNLLLLVIVWLITKRTLYSAIRSITAVAKMAKLICRKQGGPGSGEGSQPQVYGESGMIPPEFLKLKRP